MLLADDDGPPLCFSLEVTFDRARFCEISSAGMYVSPGLDKRNLQLKVKANRPKIHGASAFSSKSSC